MKALEVKSGLIIYPIQTPFLDPLHLGVQAENIDSGIVDATTGFH